jgi:two-component system sensor histidine kinase QseC
MLSSRAPGSRTPVALDPAPEELRPVLDALNGWLDRSEAALEREQRFSSDIAHELRTPLASTMIQLDVATCARDDERDLALARARRGLAELARRVEQLLALGRLEARAAADQRCVVDLVATATTVIEELAPVIGDGRVDIGLVHDTPELVVSGHQVALAALLRNLIENALRHAPGDGQVEVRLSQGVRAAIIDIIDDGPGIPPDRRAAVFTRFHREPGGRNDGYGLGLSIVQRAAELHNASIELLDSPYGRGLRVRVVIPVRADS